MKGAVVALAAGDIGPGDRPAILADLVGADRDDDVGLRGDGGDDGVVSVIELALRGLHDEDGDGARRDGGIVERHRDAGDLLLGVGHDQHALRGSDAQRLADGYLGGAPQGVVDREP